MRHRRHYNADELAHIRARYGMTTTAVIAAELGRTRASVRLQIFKHRIKRRAVDKSRIYRGWSRKPKGDCHV